jgi:N-acetylglutamate synthase-like GNAT family acetyltransferase
MKLAEQTAAEDKKQIVTGNRSEPADHPAYRTFQPGDEAAFQHLNEAWIERYFTIEERDREILENPSRFILGPGGEILFGTIDGVIVACCALVPMEEGCFEVSKMTVAEEYRSHGIGRELLEAVIQKAKEMGASRLYLETNSKLTNAIRLYRSVGFVDVPPERSHPSPYARANVRMEMMLNNA